MHLKMQDLCHWLKQMHCYEVMFSSPLGVEVFQDSIRKEFIHKSKIIPKHAVIQFVHACTALDR